MFDALASEHILLESTDAEVETASGPGALRARVMLINRMRRASTELKLYEHGYLGVCEQRAGSREPERRVALRHIDPRPTLTRRAAKTALSTALCSLALASAAGALAYNSVTPAISLSAAVASLLTAVLAAAYCLYRAQERVQFVTRHGRVAVVTLVANFGCFRACRASVPRLVAAIEAAASRAGGDKNSQLRAEVREHYRLRESGFLSADECMSAVRRILDRFD